MCAKLLLSLRSTKKASSGFRVKQISLNMKVTLLSIMTICDENRKVSQTLSVLELKWIVLKNREGNVVFAAKPAIYA